MEAAEGEAPEEPVADGEVEPEEPVEEPELLEEPEPEVASSASTSGPGMS